MKNTQKNGFPWVLRIGILLMVLNLLMTGFYLAKYVVQDSYVEPVTARSFYFQSDLLNGDTYTLPAGTQQLDISLMNYADALRKSEVAISYTVNLYKDDAQVDGYPKNGTLPVDATNGVVVETFAFSGAGTYRIEAVATAPYTKTLPSTTFVVAQEDAGITWHVEDGEGSPVCYLTISVGDYDGGIQLTKVPGGVILSPNDKFPTTVNAYTEYRLTYFKANIENVYTVVNFEVTKNP